MMAIWVKRGLNTILHAKFGWVVIIKSMQDEDESSKWTDSLTDAVHDCML